MKTYYFADDEHIDKIYGDQKPVCIDLAEVKWLANEWDIPPRALLNQMHEATADEIARYGVYDH